MRINSIAFDLLALVNDSVYLYIYLIGAGTRGHDAPPRYFVEGTRGEGTCCEEMNLVLSIPNDDNTMFIWLEQIYISQLNLGGGAFIQGCI